MKKIVLSLLIIAAFVGYLLFYRRTPSAIVVTPNPTGMPMMSTTPMMTGGSMMGARYRNGTYTGPVEDAFYGNVQVQAVVSGGKLTDVRFLQYPSDRSHSAELSRYSMPILTSEAIVAQNANVDVVSGATQTSEAFKKSLAAALSQAAL